MGQPRSKTARKFYRAAKARLDDARLLSELGRSTATVYLAGYAVECILKSLLLHSILESRHDELNQFFHGSLGHDLEALRKRLSGISGVNISRERMQDFRVLYAWTTSLRYETQDFTPKEVRTFMNPTNKIFHWATGSM